MCSDWVVIHEVVDSTKFYSLNDLIFWTPFLSLLEWKIVYECWVHSPEICQYWYLWWCADLEYQNKIDSEDQKSDYHKINLCLLNSDEDRIKYLEDNVIIDD